MYVDIHAAGDRLVAPGKGRDKEKGLASELCWFSSALFTTRWQNQTVKKWAQRHLSDV